MNIKDKLNTYKVPKNWVISDETIDDYKKWLRKFKKAQEKLTTNDDAADLFSITQCKLLAKGACVNQLECVSCEAAKSTLVWVNKKLHKDDILLSKEDDIYPYSTYDELNTINKTLALNTPKSSLITLEIRGNNSARFKRDKGQVKLSVH